MSLVDPYHDRVFRNGRLYGVNYDEMTTKPTYTDISPFGGGGEAASGKSIFDRTFGERGYYFTNDGELRNRKAGQGIGLEPDVVIYMGKAAQGMPQNESMDKRIAQGFMKAIGQLFGQPDSRTLEYVPDRDRAELRTLEYVPERDGPPTIEPIGPYNPDTDDSGFELLAGGNFMGGSASQIGPRPKGLKGITREALESLPNSGIARDKYMKIRQGIDLPRV